MHVTCLGLMDHPFNLKVGVWVFFGVKIFISLRGAAESFV